MHLLPTNLGRLAEHTQDHGGRYALDNVRLIVHGDNTFIAEATDTKVLIRVSGPCQGDPAEFPDCVPGFATAPNGKTESLIPGAAWKKAFAAAKKLTAKAKREPILRSLAVKVGERMTTFGATDTVSHQCEAIEIGTGKFPPTGDILDGRRGGDVRVTFAVDPVMLAELLRTAADLACDEEDMRVEFEVRNPNQPISIRAARPDGMKVHAIIMPLADEKKKDEPAEEEADADPAVIELEKQLGLVRAERDQLREESESKGQELITANARISEYRETITRLTDQLAAQEYRFAELANGTVPIPAAERNLTTATRPLSRRERLLAVNGGN